MEAIHRSLRKSSKIGFANSVNNSLFETYVHTEAGIFLERMGDIKIERNRFDRVAKRIMRGLFYHEFGRPLPLNYEVTNIFSQTRCADIAKRIKGVAFQKPRSIGDGVFWYAYAMTDKDPNSGVWIQVYYEGLQFLGFTTDPERKRASK